MFYDTIYDFGKDAISDDTGLMKNDEIISIDKWEDYHSVILYSLKILFICVVKRHSQTLKDKKITEEMTKQIKMKSKQRFQD